MTVSGGAPLASNPFTPEDGTLARETIVAAMTACKTARSRDANGRIAYVLVPEWGVRLAAAIKALEYCTGKPISTALITHLAKDSEPSPEEFFENLFKDPKKVAELVEMSAEIERERASADGRTIDIGPRPTLPPENDVSKTPTPPGEGAAGEF